MSENFQKITPKKNKHLPFSQTFQMLRLFFLNASRRFLSSASEDVFTDCLTQCIRELEPVMSLKPTAVSSAGPKHNSFRHYYRITDIHTTRRMTQLLVQKAYHDC